MADGAGSSDGIALAGRVAARLASVPGVVAVVLGGSQARGTADAASDVDLGIYYAPASRPALADLRTVAQEIDDRHLPDLATAYGEWGPWINGGAWLDVAGRRVDWLYRDLDRVRACIAAGEAGQVAFDYQPGHPHGFGSHIYAGEVALCRPLYDPSGALAALKRRAMVYPPALRRALVGRFLWEAGFAVATARKPAARGDVAYVAGCAFRAVACLVQVLYALNGRYLVNEKGALREAAALALRPVDVAERATEILGDLGTTPTQLSASLELLSTLRESVRLLADELGVA